MNLHAKNVRFLYILVLYILSNFKSLTAKQPVHNPAFTATPNGCGSQGIVISPTLLPNRQFLTCCNSHDYCYGSCNSIKDTCDTNFRNCMRNACKDLKCKAIAESFYNIVKTAGCKSFKEGQAKACLCK